MCVLCAAACGGSNASLTSSKTERAATPAEREAIESVVYGGQRAGFVSHDLDGYLAQWTDDAVIVGGRGPTPGEHDFSLSRAQIEATKRARFVGEPVASAMNFEATTVTLRGTTATLATTTVTSTRDGGDRVGEVYKLRKTPAGWRVFENRYWMVSSTSGGETVNYDAAHYAAADARAADARASDDNYELGLALMDGWRWTEAHAAFVALTGENDVEPNDWAMRGATAMVIGDVEDARASYAEAKAADPNMPVPM